MRTERIQDGVERLVFVAGYPAVDYVQGMDSTVDQVSSLLNTQRENIVKVLSAMKQELDETTRREKLLGEKLDRGLDPEAHLIRDRPEGGEGQGNALCLPRRRRERRTDC